MNDMLRRRFEAIVRSREFGTLYATLFPANTRGGQLFASLTPIIAEINAFSSDQTFGKRASQQSRASKDVARKALMGQLEAISRTASILARTTPGLKNKFRMPHNSSDQGVMDAARSFARDAVPFKNEFIERDLADDFLEKLDTGITDFEESINHGTRTRTVKVAATAALKVAIEKGMQILRELDVIVKNKLGNDPATLAAWKSARQVERAPRKSKDEKPKPETPVNAPKTSES